MTTNLADELIDLRTENLSIEALAENIFINQETIHRLITSLFFEVEVLKRVLRRPNCWQASGADTAPVKRGRPIKA